MAKAWTTYKYNGSFNPSENAVTTNFQFNGYTNYWHDIYRDWISYGNLFKIAIPKWITQLPRAKSILLTI